eukprot:s706_g13.t1
MVEVTSASSQADLFFSVTVVHGWNSLNGARSCVLFIADEPLNQPGSYGTGASGTQMSCTQSKTPVRRKQMQKNVHCHWVFSVCARTSQWLEKV